MNIFNSPQVTNAFARSERIMGSQRFTLDDGRTLTGTINRTRLGKTMLENNVMIEADAVVVATRPQFTPSAAGSVEILPVAKSTVIKFDGLSWRAEYVATDETHVTLYCCKTTP